MRLACWRTWSIPQSRRQSRIVPSAWPQVVDVFGTPLVIEPWPGQLSCNAGLLRLCQLDHAIGLTPAFTQTLDDPGGADLTRVLFSRPSPSRFGNKMGTGLAISAQCGYNAPAIGQ